MLAAMRAHEILDAVEAEIGPLATSACQVQGS
jgi:hypothetical protein